MTFTEDNSCRFNPIAPEGPTQVQDISEARREACRGYIFEAAGRFDLTCS